MLNKSKSNNKENKLKVLLLDGFGRQAMPVLRGLSKIGCSVTTICNSKLDVGYSSKYSHKKLIVKENDNSDSVENFVDAEIMKQKYYVVIPLSDKMTFFLSKNWDKYSKVIKSPIPNFETFLNAYDKQNTMDICQKMNIPCTRTRFLDESVDDFIIRNGGFPIAVKPRSSCGSIGFKRINNKKELDAFLKDVNIDDYVFQEFVEQDGKQFNVHAFFDNNNEASFIVPMEKCRWFPVDGGSSCFARTVNDDKLIEQCLKLLKAINWRGVCEIELIEDKKSGEKKVMEINGRPSACIKICELAGINVSKSMIEYAIGVPVTKQIKPFKDVRMRCIHTDFLWLIKSKSRFKTKPNWFNNYRTHDQIFSIFDPIPFFTFSIQSAAKYKKETKKRER